MRYGIAAIIALLALALVICARLSHKSRKSIAPLVTRLIWALILPVAGNFTIIVSRHSLVSMLGYFTYFLGMNIVVYELLRFTFAYCRLRRPGRGIRWFGGGLLILDAVQLLCNPIARHAFDLEALEVGGATYYKLIPYLGQTFHRVVCYGFFLISVGIFFWKMLSAPRLYFERYALIFFSMAAVGLWETFYIFSRSPVDRSMIGFEFFGLLVYYFAIYYRPIRLLDRMLANVASQMFQGVFFFDAVGRCVWVNDVGCEAFQIDRDNYEPVAERLAAMFGDLGGAEWIRHEVVRTEGERKYYAVEKHSIMDSRGKIAGAFLSVLDETERQEALEKNRYNATHDALTGLYSREYLYARIRETIDGNPEQTYMVCFLDISNFKLVNDVFGRDFGDFALRYTAEALRRDVGDGGICGRLGGDTFGICISKDAFNLEMAERGLENCVARRGETEYHLLVHQGVYEVNERDLDVSVMFDRANMAMESIKDEYNIHVAFYDERMRQDVLWNQRVSEELGQAIAEGQIRPYLQAIVDSDGQVVGAEALVRWIHPKEGFLPPIRFIPTIEQNGMIAQVDRYMWRRACEILSAWKDNGLFISINVSPKDFYFMDVVEELTGLVAEHGVEPSRLRVEITETVVMSDEAKRISILKQLRDAGFIVEMDDFGSGYSSLNMLKDMPVDVIKIDMGFLRKAGDDERARTILNSILQMTNNLRLHSITEGVETEEQFKALRNMGCGMFQGYYFAKPMPVDSFEAGYTHTGPANREGPASATRKG